MDDRALIPYGDGPPPTLIERLTADFYAWERRGRGWLTWGTPVELEPPFRPFYFRDVSLAPPVDDGQRPTLLSSLKDRLQKRSSRPGDHSPDPGVFVGELDSEPSPEPFYSDEPLVELQVSLPPDAKVGREAAEALILSLTSARLPLSFEVIGLRDRIYVQFVSRSGDAPAARQQLLAHFPEAGIMEEADLLHSRWEGLGEVRSALVDFGLSHEFMLPLRTFKVSDADPLVGIVGALDGLGEDEIGVLQILFQPARHPWAEHTMRSVTDWEGGAFFADAPHVVPLTKEKVSKPFFAALVRVGARSASENRAWEIARQIGGALSQFSRPSSNELIPLSGADYHPGDHEADFLARQTQRSGMLLNADEMVSLVHPPSPSVRSERLQRERRTTAEAPANARDGGLLLGENVHRGNTVEVHLPTSHRLRHVHLVGATGTGKSHLLLNLILQDIENGKGVGVLDPHGDLIDRIIERIPEHRLDDVVLLDPADEEFPVAFNILSAHSELERGLLASDLVAVFRRLATSWGDQMTSVLRNAVLAFLESDVGGTLADLRRLLVEPEYRTAFLTTVKDDDVAYFWRREFPLLSGRPQGPLLTRLDSFLAPKPLRRMVSQQESRLDFAEIMDRGRIFLARLSTGAIGEENAHLLGSVVAAKFQQLATARQARPEAERRPFYLYVDEFQNFATPSMADILSGGRKYGLGLVLAHQDLAQLDRAGPSLASAALANPATRICFRVGDNDARKLAEGFGGFEARDLASLGRGEAVCRIERSDWSFNLRTLPLPAAQSPEKRRAEVVARSRARYATAREAVESRAPSGTDASRSPAGTGRKAAATTKGARRRGRGGDQHRYLQELLAKLARERGFKVAIEKAVLSGHGHVDLLVERNGVRVGCEISVSTGSRHELENLSKCLAAGLDYAVLVSSNEGTLRNTARRFVSELSPDERQRVHFLSPEAFAEWLDGIREEAYERSPEAAEPQPGKKKRARQGAQTAPAGTRGKVPPPDGSKEMLATREAAAYVRRAPQTLAKLRSIGGGPPYYKIGRNVYYDRADLDAWLDSRKRRSTAPTEDEFS